MLSVFVACLLLVGCETSDTGGGNAAASSSGSGSGGAFSKYKAPPLTESQLATVDARSRVYFKGLERSVAAMDDGNSPPRVIAEKAVAQNMSKLISWRRSMWVNYSGPPAFQKIVEKKVTRPPSAKEIDFAERMVRRHRRG
ncbi:MAG: hypothetical protein CMO55_25040 [Verrucomicrobiales bacterium]|nr:hypothetical protein [Verrucomicrobiales bacterium]